MNFQPFIETEKLKKYIRNLITDNIDKKNKFDDLHDFDQTEIILIIMESIGSEIFNAISNQDSNIPILSFSEFLCDSSVSNGLNFAYQVKKVIIKHYRDFIQELMDEEFCYFDNELKREHGLKPVKDQINGEIRWVL